ncbi:G/U mismatch-specific DNA glycosylase [uncultured Gimesia sp.]|uniref:G/U mismatch-specific DNA glycosylase n=1 Tax=uncultured Gimesia sp. TaxID=1678688 RepID=UPI002629DA9B|nr:G/U mismatch-specific DNA glycosylase [uncultured Gimesia sp.]
MEEIWKPTADELEQAIHKQLPDLIETGLKALFVGTNPGLYSAAVGHHFARPGNRFWPAMFRGKITERLYSPFEDYLLLKRGGGLTNIVSRASKRADELSKAELYEGAEILTEKVIQFQPQKVVFLGITSYRNAFQEKQAQLGLQERTLGESEIWVLPNPSGLNAHYQIPALGKFFARMWQ